jgi:uncharacterized protein YfaS (alpha-2-macroglobulin family)
MGTGPTVIRGTVTRGGAPVEGAYVRLLDADGEYTGEQRTRSDGTFAFNACAGDWRLVVFGHAIDRAERPASVAAGEERVVEISLA